MPAKPMKEIMDSLVWRNAPFGTKKVAIWEVADDVVIPVFELSNGETVILSEDLVKAFPAKEAEKIKSVVQND